MIMMGESQTETPSYLRTRSPWPFDVLKGVLGLMPDLLIIVRP